MNTGVTINGVVAKRGGVPYGQQFAAYVYLNEGLNAISITATTLGRKQVTQELHITRTGDNNPPLPEIDLGYNQAQTIEQIDLINTANWNDMNAAFLDGNYNLGADHLINSSNKIAYTFYLLMPYMNDMVANYILFEKYKLTTTYGEYVLIDQGNNENQAFIVVYQRDPEGVWRLVEI